jgi:peptidoglycan hydrolase-like protein with peptidoglycan-binding domain
VTGVVDDATALALGLASSPLLGLSQGTRGEAVRRLQEKLIAAGVAVPGGADGIFGTGTAAAVKQFQKGRGLAQTGTVDAATAAALGSVTVGSAGSSSSGSTGSSSSGSSGSSNVSLVGLRIGSRGAAVTPLQRQLSKAGFDVVGGADGVFGVLTANALSSFQYSVGLKANAIVTEQTAAALAKAANSGGGGGGGAGAGASSPLLGLKYGSLGSNVRKLQEALMRAGIELRGGADGVFGPATSEALKAFQRSQGLAATGIVDDATAAALKNPKPITAGGGTSGSSASGYAQYGEKGARVIALQTALARAGITLRGGVDGDFGAGTSAAIMDFQRAHGLPVTGRVDDATAAKLGLSKQDAPTAPDPSTVRMRAFPVQGRCYFADSWMFPRSGGRVHLGVDIIAPQGNAVYAVADGTITKLYNDYPGSLAGNAVRLTTSDGTYFFYAHMVSIAKGIKLGSKVRAGQIVGFVGSTGSSATNHLHFEVHPRGGSAVNPYPLVKAIDACNVTRLLPQP